VAKAALTAPKSDFRYTPKSGLKTDIWPCLFRADTVEKVENREAPKISRMSNLGDLSRGKAL
jgi:hypothetical protein